MLSNKIDSVDITSIKEFIVKAIDSKQIEKYKNESVKILNNAFANQNGVNKQNINKTEVEKLARLINAGLFSLNSADATRLLLRAMGDKEASAVFDKDTYKSITDISNRIKNISEIAQGSEVLSQYAKELADELAKLIEDEKIEALQGKDAFKRIAYKVVEVLQAVTGLSMAYKLSGAFTLAQNFATSIATGIANSARAFGNLVYGGFKAIGDKNNIPLKKAKYFGKAFYNQIGATVINDTDKSTSQRIGAKSFTGRPKNFYDIPRWITMGANNLANFITAFTGSVDRVARLTQFTNSFLSQLEEKIYNNIILKNPNISKGQAKKEAIEQFGAILDAISEFTNTEETNALDVVNYITGGKKEDKEFSPLKRAIAFQLAIGNTELYYALMEAEKVAKEVSSIMTGQKESSIGILSALPTIISVGENLAQDKINALVGETEFGTWSDIGKRMLKVLTNVALQFTKAGAIWQALTFLWNSKLGVFTSGALAGSKYFGNTKAKKLDYLKSGKTVEQARKKFEKSDLQEEESISMLLNGVVATLVSSAIASYTTGVGMLDSLNLLFDDEDEEEKKKRAKKLLYASKTDWGKRFIMPEDIAIAKYILDAKKDDKSLGKFDPLILGLAKETFMAQNRYDNYNLISMFMRDDTEKEKLLLKALPLYGAFTQLPAKQWSTVSSISPKDYDNENDYKKAVDKTFEESRLYAPTEFAKKEGLAGDLASFIIGTIKFKADTEKKGKGNTKKLGNKSLIKKL